MKWVRERRTVRRGFSRSSERRLSRPVAAIDAVGVGGGGGREVVRDVVAACADRAGDGSLIVYVSDPELLGEELHQRPITVVRVSAQNYAARLRWWLRGCPRATEAAGCTAVLHMANIGWSTSPWQRSGVLVHQGLALGWDPSLRWPLQTRVRLRAIRLLVLFSAARASCVFVQSGHLASALQSQLRAGPSVRVVPPVPPTSLARHRPAGSGQSSVRDDAANGWHTFVYVGSASTHKNLDVIFAAASLLDEDSSTRFKLTVPPETAPSEGWCSVDCLGSLDRAGVAALLDGATALVMPSLAETVGLPMLEAMDFDVPVIAADRPYAHAICGDAAHYFDPLEPGDLVRACEEVASSLALRNKLIARGRARCEEFRQAQGLEQLADWLWTTAAGGAHDHAK